MLHQTGSPNRGKDPKCEGQDCNDKIADNKALCSESNMDRWDSWRIDAQKIEASTP